jgi:anaerobic magnesium-protoporphyrin IX monomethyl ester cyclase
VRVLLIAPPYDLEEHPMPPLSLSYVAGSLLDRGFEVEILDLLTSKPSAAKVRRKLEQFQPHVVGTTGATMTFPAAARLLKVCKEFDPNITTIIGGPHVSFAVEDTFRRAPWIDAVVIGEGDVTAVELVSALNKGSDLAEIPGLAFRRDGRVVSTGQRPLIQQLDELPMPARHLIPLSRYKALGLPCSVTSSRGCPYRCIFCSAPRMFGRKVRFRQPQRVVDEIEYIHRELGFDTVNIVDDTFTANRHHTEALCREIIARRLPIEWNAYSRTL